MKKRILFYVLLALGTAASVFFYFRCGEAEGVPALSGSIDLELLSGGVDDERISGEGILRGISADEEETEHSTEKETAQSGLREGGAEVFTAEQEEQIERIVSELLARHFANENCGLININTASKEELMQLKGIGSARADAIINYRSEEGLFKNTADIMRVPGIKQSVFSGIKDRICV